MRRVVTHALIMAVLLGLLISAISCTQEATSPTQTLTSPETGQDPVLKVLPSIVKVTARTLHGTVQGSGFIINSTKGYVLTDTHVVADAYSIEIALRNGVSQKATWVAQQTTADISLLSTKPIAFPSLSFGYLGDAVTLGQQLFAIGIVGDSYTSASGQVKTVQRDNAGYTIITFGAQAEQGMSGGPVVNENGQVIGIISLGYTTNTETVAIAVNQTMIYNIIDFADKQLASSPTPTPAPTSTPAVKPTSKPTLTPTASSTIAPTQFQLGSVTPIDDNGWPSLRISFTASDSITLSLMNPYGIQTASSSCAKGTTGAILHMADYWDVPQSGNYKLTVRDTWGNIISTHNLLFSGAQAYISSVTPTWQWWQYSNYYSLNGINLLVGNSGDLPIYVYDVEVSVDGKYGKIIVIPTLVILPGQQKPIYGSTFINSIPTGANTINLTVHDASGSVVGTYTSTVVPS